MALYKMSDEAKEIFGKCKGTCKRESKDCPLIDNIVYCSDCIDNGSGCTPSSSGYICVAFNCKHKESEA